MKINSKISVLLPVYNAERYLDRCILSVIKQTYENFELIIVNDGSNDNSLEIINNYKNSDPRIKLIDKINSGYGHSLNIALGSALGEYITILEADDFYEPRMLEKMLEAVLKDNCDIAKCNYNKFLNVSAKKNKILEIKQDEITSLKNKPDMLLYKPAVWSFIYKREFLARNNILFEETTGASFQDTSFFQKVLISAQKIALITDSLINYSIDNINSSINSKERPFAIVREFEIIRKFLEHNKNSNLAIQQFYYISMYKAYKWNLKRLSRKNKARFLVFFSMEFLQLYKESKLSSIFFKKVSKFKFNLLLNKKKLYYFLVLLEEFKDKSSLF